ncbi:hypothetical protein HGA13_18205 [Nocardia speluncae]|uniref:Uncharacterized protein n=1 Tax=Nocardia speluncae TaxID=419477 RepID=A0A846XK06_9NOCA|nr:hypothetical protein [Nocardia speluncae]NKY34990.1 hypothetical protein [Nocardia speluncae]
MPATTRVTIPVLVVTAMAVPILPACGTEPVECLAVPAATVTAIADGGEPVPLVVQESTAYHAESGNYWVALRVARDDGDRTGVWVVDNLEQPDTIMAADTAAEMMAEWPIISDGDKKPDNLVGGDPYRLATDCLR